jgi:nicotinamide-nucleotide amidase
MPPLYVSDAVWQVCEQLAQTLVARHETLATAESCTGGLIAATCTAISGSSLWLEQGFVTYSNGAKTQQLGVPPELIAQHGAVSEAVALAMAQGALAHSEAHWSVAVTGVAGPTGGSADKPVGTVWLAWAGRQTPPRAELRHFRGDRAAVRASTVACALQGLLTRIRTSPLA